MSIRLDEAITTPTPDKLINSVYPPADAFSVVIRKGSEAASYKRGTVLALAEDGKMVILGTEGTEGTFTATGNGTATVFSLIDSGVIPAGVSEVKVDGTALTSGFMYNPASGDLIFDTAPANAKVIAVKTVIGSFVANAILAEDVDVGTTADAVAVAYRTGHFNSNGLIVASGYTFTAADKEALRSAGILISDAVEA